MGFDPVAAIGRLVQKYERDSSIQKEIQYTKQYERERERERKNKRKNNIKKCKSSNYKITKRSKQ